MDGRSGELLLAMEKAEERMERRGSPAKEAAGLGGLSCVSILPPPLPLMMSSSFQACGCEKCRLRCHDSKWRSSLG
jgi:hypothetical protein